MEIYDYEEAVTEDIKDYIKSNYNKEELKEELENRDDFEQELYDTLFVEDYVTGNGSGSYYCNRWKAEEALCHNLDLLGEALEEFGDSPEYLKNGAEACDVTIRCYLLGRCLGDVLDELEEELLDEELENEEDDNGQGD